jgi:hypothetical protein
MKTLRILALVLSFGLMLGEAYRSWGAGRPVVYWMDDMLMGGLLIVSAWAVRKHSWQRRALFTGVWGAGVGMLYASFFGKIYEPTRSNSGNFDLGVLTVLVGIAFVTAIAGFVASLLVKPPSER